MQFLNPAVTTFPFPTCQARRQTISLIQGPTKESLEKVITSHQPLCSGVPISKRILENSF